MSPRTRLFLTIAATVAVLAAAIAGARYLDQDYRDLIGQALWLAFIAVMWCAICEAFARLRDRGVIERYRASLDGLEGKERE